MRGDVETDKRKWHVDKGIPVALIVSMAGALFLGGIAYQSIRGEQTKQSDEIKEVREEIKQLRVDFATIVAKQQDSRLPSEQLTWQVNQLRTDVTDLKALTTEGSRHRSAIDSRLQRIENAQINTQARLRAREER